MKNIYESWGVGLDASVLEVGNSSDNNNPKPDEINEEDLYDPLNGKLKSSIADEELDELEDLVKDLGINDDYFTDCNEQQQESEKETKSVSESNLDSLVDNTNVKANAETVTNGTVKQSSVKPINQTQHDDGDGILKYLPMIKKIVLISLITIIGTVILFGSGVLSSNSKDIGDAPTSSGVASGTPSLDNMLLLNDSFVGLSDYINDMLIVEKKSIISGDSLVTLLCGSTTKSKVQLTVPVSIDLYNSIEDGSIVKVKFKQLKISDVIYNTDVVIGEVVE